MSDLTPEALDTIEAEDHAVNCSTLDIDSHTIGFDPEKCDCYVVELRRLRTENEEQQGRIAAALAVHPKGWSAPVLCTCAVCTVLAGAQE